MMRPEASNLRRWAWRVPLIVAVLAMLFAAALVSMGQRAVSDVFVTMGFAFWHPQRPDLDAHRQGANA